MKKIFQKIFIYKSFNTLACLFFLICLTQTSYAITWTYYDINNDALVNPTTEEIEQQAVMRVSDNGVTQYALEIRHDFSETWGTGYLENIGNPMPGIGKEWINLDEQVVCSVDGIVQDVYNMNSRYVAVGFYAQGPPNSKDAANALRFDGDNDYVETNNIDINKSNTLTIEFWAKRDRTQATEYLMSHGSNGFKIGFNSSDKAVFNTGNLSLTASSTTDTSWHHWEFVIKKRNRNYKGTTGYGITIKIYCDGIKYGETYAIPDCWQTEHAYVVDEMQKGCYLPDTDNIIELEMKEDRWGDWDYDDLYKQWNKQCRDIWTNDTRHKLDRKHNYWGHEYEYSFSPLVEEADSWGWYSWYDGHDPKHPYQVCAKYMYDDSCCQDDDYYCVACYGKGEWHKKSECDKLWFPESQVRHREVRDYQPWEDAKDRDRHELNYDYYDRKQFLKRHIYKTESRPITKYYYTSHCKNLLYDKNSILYIGKDSSGNYFKGQIKDIIIKRNNTIIASYKFNDGNQSTTAIDSSRYSRNGTLKNFDMDVCWVIDPKLTRHYEFDSIEDRQTVHKFIMSGPAKIIYDWGRQHAVSMNTLPELMSDKVSVQVVDDESQAGYETAGKFWYNHDSKLILSGKEGTCLQLNGYRDSNNIDPTELISSNKKYIEKLEGPETISWVYLPFLYEETVTLGTPVMLSTLPPEIMAKLKRNQKPTYTSTHISEQEMIFWNETEKKVYPLRGGETFDLEFDMVETQCKGDKVILTVKTIWPDSPHIIHVGKTPPVNLDPSPEDDIHFLGMKHVENDANVIVNKFSASEKGRSVLLFARNYIKDSDPKEISLNFDGDGYVDIGNIEFGKNFTIEFWANRSNYNNYNIVIGQGIPENNQGLVIGFSHNDNFIFETYGNALSTNDTYTSGTWHHFACVYETDISGITEKEEFSCQNDPNNDACKWKDDTCYTQDFKSDYDDLNDNSSWNEFHTTNRVCGQNIQYKRSIYCDGVLVAQDVIHSAYQGHGNMRVGLTGSGWDNIGHFQGHIDELRIWNAARIANEIADNKDNRLEGNEENLIRYFRFDRIGSSFVDNQSTNRSIIGMLMNMDPSNSWRVNTTKQKELTPYDIPSKGMTVVRVVETKSETDNKIEDIAVVGQEISSIFHDDNVTHNGYVFFQQVPFNADIYNPETLQGSIYPVNSFHPASDSRDKILVIWYKMQDNIFWPYQPVDYTCQWHDAENRIVIASRLGSDGKDKNGHDQLYPDVSDNDKNYFDPARFKDIKVYNQPDPNKPGYNPNEEHALVSNSMRNSSMAPRPQAVFALRNDINIMDDPEKFTSNPCVLVQMYDAVLNKHVMIPYDVEIQDSTFNYTFHYYMQAGDPVVAPYPLNEVIGATPPSEIFGKNHNPDKLCYWKDHKGQDWAISGSGESVEVIEATLLSSDTASAEYGIKIKNHTFINNHHYMVKVTDKQGVIGYSKFKVSYNDTELANAAVYVNGSSIAGVGADTFTVVINFGLDIKDPGIDSLVSSNFKLFHYDSDAPIKSYFWYPIQPSFWIDENTPGNGQGLVGISIPWLPDGTISSNDGFPQEMTNKQKAVEVTYDVVWPDNIPVLKSGESLTFPGGEYRADNTESPGLPGALGWASGQVVFDSLNPNMDTNKLYSSYLVRLVPALVERTVPLSLDNIPDDLKPASGRVDVFMNRWYFNQLHSGIKKRLFYDPTSEELGFRGFVNNKTIGDDSLTASPPSIFILQPNIMTDRERQFIKSLEGANSHFKQAVDSLYALSRNPKNLNNTYTVGLELFQNQLNTMIAKHSPKSKILNDMYLSWLGTSIINSSSSVIPKISFGPGLAVIPNPAFLDPADNYYKSIEQGYVTIAENNHPDLGALPISLHIIKVVKDKVRGAIKVTNSDNVFDEKVTLRHSADFGANADDLIFQWRYRESDGTDQATPDIAVDKWLPFPDPLNTDGLGMSEINLGGAGAVLLVDNLFFVRYRHKNSDPADASSWSDWAGAANSKPGNFQPQLSEGWVKRVLNAVNPFEARIKNFYNTDSPATYVSMIRQAGPRYEGPIAFNPDKDVIENVGLIELYQTVLNRAMDLSINLEQPASTSGITTALMLAATRISGFYSLLGNEAYIDALDPTIGFGTNSVEYGSLAPTIFTFMNQVPDLIDEEIVLLCGRQEDGARPAYNKFLWNFSKGDGEVAYALSYNIDDTNKDGFIDEADARTLYPQGHGDAWGHYLTAVKCYYDLLRHPHFNWESRSEKFSVEGVVIDVDYFDERKFAEAAAAKAKTGGEIVNLIYRENYVEDPNGQWQGYQDTEKDRAWGVSGWSKRAFLGSYFDWVMANALIPEKDPDESHVGIKKVDRSTVMDILEIASQARNINQQYDNANNGINPLGLSTDVVPFDINPALLIPGPFMQTHFEQVYERAVETMDNARIIFDHANNIKNRIRQVANEEQEFTDQVIDQDREYRNQLIEIFGTPYEGTIGAGKVYPEGYKGPDYYYYCYIDVNEVSAETIPPPSEDMTAYFEPMNMLYVPGDDGSTHDNLPSMFTHFFDSDLEGSAYVDTDFSGVLEITFPVGTKKYSFQAPPEWGQRRSPGEIQLALIELIKAESDLQIALAEYAGLMGAIYYTLRVLQGSTDFNASQLEINNDWSGEVESFNMKMLALRTGADLADIAADALDDAADATAEALPTNVGMSNDATSGARAAIKTAAGIASKGIRVGTFASRVYADELESEKEVAALSMEESLIKAGFKYEVQQQLKEIEALLGDEAKTRINIFQKREHMRQVSEKYRATLSKGLRLLEERKVYNARVAAKTQGNRYMDMAFRLSRNDALSKFRNAFDLAARYVYLAAKAYDYETNLSDMDPASPKPLLTDIVKQRRLGQYLNGGYVIGQGGLGDILASLKVNFDTLKGQMGLDSPQTETGRFSLRTELFRIKADNDNDASWREELKKKRVDDLWAIPEFRKFCRPFTSEDEGVQPGIVIDFSSNITFGLNFFGWPLSGGDHAYDPTNFATKVRSIGVWFEGYDNSLLSETPRVYMVPSGMDVMLVSDSTDLDSREWNVVDQRLPVPLPIRSASLNNPDWIPILDSLDGPMMKIRRLSSFRAYHDSGYFDENQMSFESRLIGRSVWNTKWLLIIPGGTFHFDKDYGLDTFIDHITDIKLFFQTYAISGN
jgi:hypothetical protein